VSQPEEVKFVLSGKGKYPYSSREQWTDACNLVALRPGIVVGYDRNPVTIAHFNEIMAGEPGIEDAELKSFVVDKNALRFSSLPTGAHEMDHVIHAEDLFEYLDQKQLDASETKKLLDQLQNILFLIPSSELSRARGGSHCMTLPLVRG
ncbi:MAG: arginine deiminase family protein, partial [Bacteroidota bacterium]